MKKDSLIRIFIGIPMPDAFLHSYSLFLQKNKQYNIRWVKESNTHITLLFIGNIMYNELEKYILKISEIIYNTRYFKLKYDNIKLMPDIKPYMIWAVFKRNKDFEELSNNLHNSFNVNNEKEKIPHCTLARFKAGTLNNFNLIKNKFPKQIVVNKIFLWQSVLKNTGAEYYKIAEFPLFQ